MMADSTGSGSDLKASQKTGHMAISLIRHAGRSQESNAGPPGLQSIGYRGRNSLFLAMFLGYNQYWPSGFMFFQEHPMVNRQWFGF